MTMLKNRFLICILLAGCAVFSLSTVGPVRAVSDFSALRPSSARTISQVQIPKGIEKAALPLRNPFQAPDNPVLPVKMPIGTVPVPPPAAAERKRLAALPVVEGIASAGAKRLAIIRHAGASRPYASGETVGEYLVISITNDVVTLEGAGGRFELTKRGL